MPKITPIPPRLNISPNIQVTRSLYIDHARSESVVAINPFDGDNIIAAAKRFRNLYNYDFVIEAAASFDNGKTWQPSTLPLHRDWGVNPGISDPTIAWDGAGWAYLIVGPHWDTKDPHDAVGYPGLGIGVWAYISKNGGKSWQYPIKISDNRDDDKQWAAGDTSHASPHFGNVYVAWGADTPLRFARSRNPGLSWTGPGSQTPERSSLAQKGYAPEISVGPDGTIYIFWHNDGSDSIQLVKSSDGGHSFSAPQTVVKGLKSIRGHAPAASTEGNWPHLPGGKFRVITLVTCCVVDVNTLIVAWADYRDGVARIYYRRSLDRGENWEGPPAGQLLLPPAIASSATAHDFHPQILALPNGTVGCAFYEFGPNLGGHPGNLVDVVLVASLDRGATFTLRESVCDKPWDPAVGAPLVHGDPEVTFIGEYFGLDADKYYFRIVWTDTRTGMQELFTAQSYVQTSIIEFEPLEINEIVFIPRHGSEDGILFNWKTGKIIGPIPYPQWNLDSERRRMKTGDARIRQISALLDAFTIVESIGNVNTRSVQNAIMDSIHSIATPQRDAEPIGPAPAAMPRRAGRREKGKT